MLLLTKAKVHMSNVHYSEFLKHLQTKSNLHISISQSKLKHKCQPLDSGHPVSNCNPQHMYSCIFTICINLHLFFSWNFDFSVKQSSRQPQKAFPCNFNHTTQSRALPKVWVTVNPISTKGADYAHHSTIGLVWLKFTVALAPLQSSR